MAMKPRRELTAFVREVVLPAGPDRKPVMDARRMFFPLRLGRSKIHGWGLFAVESIPQGRRVIEYTGERIGGREAERRSVRPSVYLFRVGPSRFVDGVRGGSGAECINHSCDPNMTAAITNGRIWLKSLRMIPAGEELTYDYRLSTGVMMPCRCGAANCSRYLNRIR